MGWIVEAVRSHESSLVFFGSSSLFLRLFPSQESTQVALADQPLDFLLELLTTFRDVNVVTMEPAIHIYPLPFGRSSTHWGSVIDIVFLPYVVTHFACGRFRRVKHLKGGDGVHR